jgi:WD40 repeat protein
MASLAAGTSIQKRSMLKRSYSDTQQQQFASDKIPSQLRSIKPLSENLNPIEEESLGGDDLFFGRSKLPFSGFDQDNVIVPKTKQRQIPKIPFKVLDAPALKDDYYLNLVDWSEQNDLVVGLSSCVYIWSATSSKVTKLHDLGNCDEVTSVNWARRGTHLSVGTDSGIVQVWDL